MADADAAATVWAGRGVCVVVEGARGAIPVPRVEARGSDLTGWEPVGSAFRARIPDSEKGGSGRGGNTSKAGDKKG